MSYLHASLMVPRAIACRVQSMAHSIASIAKTQEIRQRMHEAAKKHATVLANRGGALPGVLTEDNMRRLEGVARAAGGSSVGSSRRGHRAAVALNKATGMPAYMTDDEAARGVLTVGGRYDMTEMQREAVERKRAEELARMEKVRRESVRVCVCLCVCGHCAAFELYIVVGRRALRLQLRC
jgi:hypothetical protein